MPWQTLPQWAAWMVHMLLDNTDLSSFLSCRLGTCCQQHQWPHNQRQGQGQTRVYGFCAHVMFSPARRPLTYNYLDIMFMCDSFNPVMIVIIFFRIIMIFTSPRPLLSPRPRPRPPSPPPRLSKNLIITSLLRQKFECTKSSSNM